MACGQVEASSRLGGQYFLQLTDLSKPCACSLGVNKSRWVGTLNLLVRKSSEQSESLFNLCCLIKGALRGCICPGWRVGKGQDLWLQKGDNTPRSTVCMYMGERECLISLGSAMICC